jgi:hypothetical protein
VQSRGSPDDVVAVGRGAEGEVAAGVGQVGVDDVGGPGEGRSERKGLREVRRGIGLPGGWGVDGESYGIAEGVLRAAEPRRIEWG